MYCKKILKIKFQNIKRNDFQNYILVSEGGYSLVTDLP